MPRVAWVFKDTETDATEALSVNPNKGGVPTYRKRIGYRHVTDPTAAPVVFQGGDEVGESSFSGFTLTPAQYGLFRRWFQKTVPVEITDDLSRVMTVLITSFQPERDRQNTGVNHPAKHTYTCNYMILSVDTDIDEV